MLTRLLYDIRSKFLHVSTPCIVMILAGISCSHAEEKLPALTHIQDYDNFISVGGDPFAAPFHKNIPEAGSGGFTKIHFAAAVAARGNDIFVADSGQRLIFRIDRAMHTISTFATLPAGQTPGLYLTDALSLFVVDQIRGQVTEYSRDGNLLATFRNPMALPSPVDVAESVGLDRILVADSTRTHVAAFNRLGGLIDVIGQNINLPHPMVSVVAMATTEDRIYLLDKTGHKVHVLSREGILITDFGDTYLKQPSALAIDHCGRIIVADQFDNAIYIFQNTTPLEVHANRHPGLTGFQLITDLWVDQEYLYVADGPSGKISLFRVETGCQ